jgi:hypothetical protein
MTPLARPAVIVLSFMALWVTAGVSHAQIVPYKASGTGVYTPSTGDYSGPGVATHMGQLTYVGNVAVFPTSNPLVFDFQSTVDQETIGATGDKIFFSFSGQVELIPLDDVFTTFSAVWSGEFVVEGGTGRFARVGPADEPLQVVATNDPFTIADPEWTYTWTVDGKIKLH